MKWRLVEEFGVNCFTKTDDGRLLFSADYTDMENLVTWLMTFGAKTEVLEPVEEREILRRNVMDRRHFGERMHIRLHKNATAS